MTPVARLPFCLTPALLLCCLLVAGFVSRSRAADAPAAQAQPMTEEVIPADYYPQSATLNLINRLVERGVLAPQDTVDLRALAEADAAEARAQAALTQAALAQAAAAQARARAVAIQSDFRRAAGTPAAEQAPNMVATAAPVAASSRPGPDGPLTVSRAGLPSAPVTRAEPTPAPAALAAAPAGRAVVPRPVPGQAAAPAPTQSAATRALQAQMPADIPVPDDVVRVAYIPEVVRQQLREEVKQDVMEQARRENWASPRAFPEWVSRFRLFGDLRTRGEAIKYPLGNDNTGSFPNFNAINTGAPFDVSGTQFSPQYNVDQDRSRARLRARVGAAVDLGQSFSVGLRAATGESNSPVSQNQSLGLAGSGSGGNFSKYAVWLDRAFLRYELLGRPDHDYIFSAGRFDNPFLSTSAIWADDLGFDGLAVQGKFPVTEDVTPFFTVGAFPVFNTDLNFASNQPAKFKSNDKWLKAAQIGTSLDFSKDFAAKLGVAYYQFSNIAGKLSSPFTPVTAADASDTDASRPGFAQKGNTYIPIRNITANALNNNGTTNQFQYFGLATPFQVTALDARIDFNHFEPFQISLSGEYLKNRAFDSAEITKNAINNRGAPTTGSNPLDGPFLGGPTAWVVNLTLGDALLQKRWDWSTSLGYRRVESDAVVDGFNDSDFGGGGTNVKGLVFAGNVMLSPGVWMGLKWMSASEVAGPAYKTDTVQIDLNARF